MSAPATESPVTAPVGLESIVAAHRRVEQFVRRTPLERSVFLSERSGVDVLLKLECWQRTRSFKVRGAFNAIAALSDGVRARGVVTASAGNHGLAVALAAHDHGISATVFLPATAPAVKQQRIRALGADLRNDARDYDDAEQRATDYAREHGLHFVHPYSAAEVIAGQGTVGLEIMEDAGPLWGVIVPVGGGGLIGGVGAVVKSLSPDTQVIGVQSEETRAMYEAFAAGGVVAVPITPTLADGLAGCTDRAAYDQARAVTNEIVLVDENAIAESIRQLYVRDGIVAEGAAAVAAAALLTGSVTPRGPVALVVSGGNIDGGRLGTLLQQAEV
jgi:threonine dehydratase